MYLSWLPAQIGYTSDVTCPAQGQVDVNLSATLYFTHSLTPSHVIVENLRNTGNITLQFNDGSNVIIPAATTDIITLTKYQTVSAINAGSSDITLSFIDAANARAYLDNYKQSAVASQSSMLRFLWQFSNATFTDSAALDQPAFAIGANTIIHPSGGKFTGYLEMPTAGVDDGLVVVPNEPWDFPADLFTIDFWLRYDHFTPQSNQVLLALHQADRAVENLCRFTYSTGASGTWQLTIGTTVTTLLTNMGANSNWQHIAIVKLNNLLSIYCNGVRVSFSVAIPTAWANFTKCAGLSIGSGTSSADYKGDICELRYVRYPAWISNFTPPSQPYL